VEGASSSGVYLWGDPFVISYRPAGESSPAYNFEAVFIGIDPGTGQLSRMSWKGPSGTNGPWTFLDRN
jgi:hypothetical protein